MGVKLAGMRRVPADSNGGEGRVLVFTLVCLGICVDVIR